MNLSGNRNLHRDVELDPELCGNGYDAMCQRISCPVVRVIKKESGPWILVIFPGNQSVPWLLKYFTKTVYHLGGMLAL